jgi:hypothetical protein
VSGSVRAALHDTNDALQGGESVFTHGDQLFSMQAWWAWTKTGQVGSSKSYPGNVVSRVSSSGPPTVK